ncbi:hypothetical protein EJ04DRAFT_549453 [Polyplosphaeria fusca]|uniref:Uncharacterized protein n=1 Tax=Polyplosphaeria fusca TaxID=682080 RepID=A0A9P4V6W3_9PLEO|nr:hypothetical protein EJ04DRAFT_549453 [Polyplosphaeria fusca]
MDLNLDDLFPLYDGEPDSAVNFDTNDGITDFAMGLQELRPVRHLVFLTDAEPGDYSYEDEYFAPQGNIAPTFVDDFPLAADGPIRSTQEHRNTPIPQDMDVSGALTQTICPDLLLGCDFQLVKERPLESGAAKEAIVVNHERPIANHGSQSTPCDVNNNSTDMNRKRASKRTSIPPRSRLLLEEALKRNAYPSEGELMATAQAIHLPFKTVRTWFANTRTRRLRKGNQEETNACSTDENPLDSIARSFTPMSGISMDSLDAHDRESRASSSFSMDRYLAASANEEPVADVVLDSVLESALQSDALKPPESSSPPNRIASSYFSPLPPPASACSSSYVIPQKRASSVASSPYSVGSFQSNASHGSYIVRDSRGSRKGRRQWSSASSPGLPGTSSGSSYPAAEGLLAGTMPTTQNPTMTVLAKSTDIYFCTSRGCKSIFSRKSDWTRHEEAVHYCPAVWECCHAVPHDHSIDCCFICGKTNIPFAHIVDQHFDKPCPPGSVFMRKDQLVGHIRRIHLKNRDLVPSLIPTDWKVDNTALSPEALFCGFCGEVFSKWKARQSHVAQHMEKGFKKSAWWPQRKCLPQGPSIILGPFQCPSCNEQFPNILAAIETHAECRTWSCRYLYEISCAFEQIKGPFAVAPDTICRLCSDTMQLAAGYNSYPQLHRHAEIHKLGHCDQSVFAEPDSFLNHLMSGV